MNFPALVIFAWFIINATTLVILSARPRPARPKVGVGTGFVTAVVIYGLLSWALFAAVAA